VRELKRGKGSLGREKFLFFLVSNGLPLLLLFFLLVFFLLLYIFVFLLRHTLQIAR